MSRRTLADLKRGQQARIVRVGLEDLDVARRLIRLGVLPGMRIRLIQSFPSVVFALDETWIAVDIETARQVIVTEG